MNIRVFNTKPLMSCHAAKDGAATIRAAIAERGEATIVVATGMSQMEMLSQLAQSDQIDWYRVHAFHLDEYVGLPITHPGSFRQYLWERFVRKLPFPLRAFHYINAEDDPLAECERLGRLITQRPVDVALVGIGENGHLAFNDPPADFETTEPYIIAELDEACRKQQLGEGWFESLDQVPRQAITMSVHQIMSARHIVCTVPDERKATAVRNALEGEVSPTVPASILQRHASTTVYLDSAAASLCQHIQLPQDA